MSYFEDAPFFSGGADYLRLLEEEKDLRRAGKLQDSNGWQYYYIADDMDDFLKMVESIPESQLRCTSSKSTDDSSWRGSASFEEAIDQARNPYNYFKQVVRDIAEDKSKNIEDVPYWMVEDADIAYDVTGNYIDIGRHMEGHGDSFVNTSGTKRTLLPYVKLLIKTTNISAGVGSTSVIRFASDVTKVVHQLQQIGIATSIVYTSIGETSCVSFPIKDYKEHVNLYRLYSILHPSFFRRLVFRTIENSPTYSHGYGDSRADISIEKFNEVKQENAIAIQIKDDFPSIMTMIGEAIQR